ncbi:MAG: dihydrofolate reductase [Akkermansiaceae bacterium]|nr:dihydrofolate reductase [Akkermansiaceae bacterium]
MNRLIAIVAMTQDRVIGHNGGMPWHLPQDLAFFKRTTSGHPIVMGRKTYESIGRALPNRRNIVMTRDRKWSAEGVEVIHTLEDLEPFLRGDSDVYIIGGSEIYAIFLPRVDELLISHVSASHQGDTWFPAYENSFPHAEVIETHETFEIRRHLRA